MGGTIIKEDTRGSLAHVVAGLQANVKESERLLISREDACITNNVQAVATPCRNARTGAHETKLVVNALRHLVNCMKCV